MKAIAKLGALVLCVLVAFTACDLFTGISVEWTTSLAPSPPGSAIINYTAHNVGMYDLTGVNLQIAALSGTAICATGWTPSFSLAQGQYYSSSIILNTGAVVATDGTVIAIDMDKP